MRNCIPLLLNPKSMISVAYYSSPVGILRITADEKVLRSISYVEEVLDDETPLTALLTRCINQFDEYFSGQRTDFDLPLHIEGTSFQQHAWESLKKIPYAETRSYAQQAQSIGSPKAVRAIGQANNRNPLSIVIPCHRVISSSGTLTGYAGGLDKKQWLLEHEQKHLSRGLS